MKVFFIELNLTRSCNCACSYCDIFRPVTDEPEVDIDFLKYVLKHYDTPNLMVELTGGEIGLIKNLDEVFKTVYNHKNVVKIQVMSNGLVRLRGVDWLDKVTYNEHLIYDIVDKDIKKHYDLPIIFRPNHYYVVVTTEKTTKSLLKNFDYFKSLRMFSSSFWYKIMNPKVVDIGKFHTDLEKFFGLLGDKNSIEMIECFRGKDFSFKRSLCAKSNPQPAVDFETKELVHCGIVTMKCERSPATPQNVEESMRGVLFKEESYCDKCYTFDNSPGILERIIDCKKGKYWNRRIK